MTLRRRIWMLRIKFAEARLAAAKLEVMRLENKLAEVELDGCNLTLRGE